MLRSPAHRWLTSLSLALTIVLLAVGAAPPTPAAANQQPDVTASFRAEFPVNPPMTGTIEAVQMVVDFPAGARVGRHTHGGPGYITMLQNDLVMWIGAEPMRTYTRGESFVEPFRLVAEGANLGAEPSSVLVTYLLPLGAPVTMLEQADTSAAPAAGQLPPGAAPRFESRMQVEDGARVHTVTQALRNHDPGASTYSWIPERTMALLTVVEGEVTVLQGDSERVYRPGEQWTEVVGRATLSHNPGSQPAVAAISVLHLVQ